MRQVLRDQLCSIYGISGALFVSSLLLPSLAFAQIKYTLDSHLEVGSIEDLLVAILKVFIVVATPIIVIAIIYGGYLYVTARGNAQQVQQASRALTYAIIGGVLVIGAVAISQIVADTTGALVKP